LAPSLRSGGATERGEDAHQFEATSTGVDHVEAELVAEVPKLRRSVTRPHENAPMSQLVGASNDVSSEGEGHPLSPPGQAHGDEQIGAIRRLLVETSHADDLAVGDGGKTELIRTGSREPADEGGGRFRRRRTAAAEVAGFVPEAGSEAVDGAVEARVLRRDQGERSGTFHPSMVPQRCVIDVPAR
jgi:hypothetical protein